LDDQSREIRARGKESALFQGFDQHAEHNFRIHPARLSGDDIGSKPGVWNTPAPTITVAGK
jgi:hypothetical protein